ncbi:MAG: hypothetical protein M1825_000055 [Sarcosagium campestre]|nr:MAG: hypothetical protein M1825_000055 [Sarcosagium campestre]
MSFSQVPTGLLSPSQARQQLALAKDWAYVDSWLESKYAGRPIPGFERNADTLAALLSLAAFNEAADEKNALLAQVESKALSELRAEADADPNAPLLVALEECLSQSGRQSLEAISSLSVILACPSVSPEAIGSAIISQTESLRDMHRRCARIDVQQKALEAELAACRALLASLEADPILHPAASLAEKTAERIRATKQISSKLAEYRSRISSLPAREEEEEEEEEDVDDAHAITVGDVVALEREVRVCEAAAKEAEGRVKVFKGLPWDKRQARGQVENAVRELDRLVAKRDGLFEGLVEEGSGRVEMKKR